MKLSRRALIHNDMSCVLGVRNFSWKYCGTRETSRVPRRSRSSGKAKQISFTALLLPQRRRRPLQSKGFEHGKLYSKRVEKRFIQKEGGGAFFLEPPTTPRTGVTIALNWNCIHYTSLCQDENAPRRSLFFTTFRSSFSSLQASCRNCRRRRRLLLRGTSAPQGTDAGNITSSSPFYGYCYVASAPYFYAPCLCELLYASGVYTRRIYPYNVD